MFCGIFIVRLHIYTNVTIYYEFINLLHINYNCTKKKKILYLGTYLERVGKNLINSNGNEEYNILVFTGKLYDFLFFIFALFGVEKME